MTTQKIQEIAQIFVDNPHIKPIGVMYGYIFGIYWENEHYSVEEIQRIKDTVVSITTVVPEDVAIDGTLDWQETPAEPTIEEVVQSFLS